MDLKTKERNTADDDIWYEIFLRIPLASIFRFKSVSKVWLSTLSNPNFINHWYKLNIRLLPWVLVKHAIPADDDSRDDNEKFRRMFSIACHDSHSQFIENHQNGFSLSFLKPDFKKNGNDQQRTKLFILGSSNGLVLCTPEIFSQNTYFVCNPLTKKWVSLPPPPTTQGNHIATGFMCNDKCFSSSLISTGFKVIRIPKFVTKAKEFKIEEFCSDLGEWNVYDVPCPPDATWIFSRFDNLVTHNDVLYWFQKRNSKILAVGIGRNTNCETCACDCRLINIPERAVDGGLELHHLLGESEGLICYAMVNEKEKSLNVWVLEGEWCLLYKDDKFHEMLTEMEPLLIGEIGKIDLTQLRILGFNPVDKNVVILGYGKHIWAYNTRTKECEQLSHPSFLRTNCSVSKVSFLNFALKPRPSVLPSVSW